MADAEIPPLLACRGVRVAFGDRIVLDGVDLAVAETEIVALLGPSGSGKSTLLRVIAGLLRADRGTIEVGGVAVDDVPTHRRDIGMVFQDGQLFPHRTVGQNVEFGLRMRGTPRTERRSRVAELLTLVGLDDFADRRVTDLSGGEARRVALARSLAPSPRLLLLDEPLTGLDRDLHDQLAAELGRVLRATRTTALLVTHDSAEAAVVADRTVRLDELGNGLGAGSSGFSSG